jgi:hypothetical protein
MSVLLKHLRIPKRKPFSSSMAAKGDVSLHAAFGLPGHGSKAADLKRMDLPWPGGIGGDGVVVGRRCICVRSTPGKAQILRICVGMATKTAILLRYHIGSILKIITV